MSGRTADGRTYVPARRFNAHFYGSFALSVLCLLTAVPVTVTLPHAPEGKVQAHVIAGLCTAATLFYGYGTLFKARFFPEIPEGLQGPTITVGTAEGGSLYLSLSARSLLARGLARAEAAELDPIMVSDPADVERLREFRGRLAREVVAATNRAAVTDSPEQVAKVARAMRAVQ